MRYLIPIILLAIASASFAADKPPILGDYDSELRLADGHVDLDLMIKRLQDMGADTFFWLIWHKPTDWEDLQAFLPKAAAAKIDVWAYIVPWTESGFGGLYSEPYRTDFVKWAEEIGKLSVKHPNLIGYVIDDFWANVRPERFTPEYLKQMVAAGKAINPKLKFYPLMYYNEFGSKFGSDLGPFVDGVVAAYPRSREEILAALPFLHDDFVLPAGLNFVYPGSTPSKVGDLGTVTQTVQVEDAAKARLAFHYRDSYDGPTTGYHVLQVSVDDQVVWEQDIGGADDGKADIPLDKALTGKQTAELTIGVRDLKPVAEYEVLVTIDDLQATGLKLRSLDQPDAWQQSLQGKFEVVFGAKMVGQKRFHLPLIVMPAGSRSEYKHRFNEEATPESIAARVKQAVDLAVEGQVEGVVIYCLNKTPGNPDLDAVADVFKAAK